MIEFKRRFVLLSALIGVGFASGAYAGDAQIKSWANNVSLDWLSSTIWENGYVPTNATDTVNLSIFTSLETPIGLPCALVTMSRSIR